MRDQPHANPRSGRGELSAAISREVVGLLREYTGRGPTKARTYIQGDLVVCVLEDTLTKGEQAMVANGEGRAMLESRHAYQRMMSDDARAKVAELTGRKVVAFLSDNHIDPDLAVETFLLDSPPAGDPTFWQGGSESES